MAVLQDYIDETVQRAQYQITVLGNEIVTLREDNLPVDCNIDKIRELQAGVTYLQSDDCCATDDELKIAADYLNRAFDLVDLPLHVYDDSCLQAPIFTPRVNIKGDTGPQGEQGEKGDQGDPGDSGADGDKGDKGWAPIIDLVPDGDRIVMRVLDWTGGEGTKPTVGLYISTSQGLVGDISQATDVRGIPGMDGNNGSNGSPGINGFNGWSPILSIQNDVERRVLKVEDWTGGTGTKPSSGDYIGVGGLVPNIADGIDIRGPEGVAFSEDVLAATTADLGAVTYDTGTLTLTSDATEVFPNQDDITLATNDYLLVKNQIDPIQNGIYYLADKGSVTTPWKLTRRDDLNSTIEFKKFVTVFVLTGTVQAEQSWTITEDRDALDMDVTSNTWARQKTPTDNLTSLYTGSDSAANILLKDPEAAATGSQVWWALDEFCEYHPVAAVNSTTGAAFWQKICVTYNSVTNTFELPTNEAGQTQQIGEEIIINIINTDPIPLSAAAPELVLSSGATVEPQFHTASRAVASDIGFGSFFGLSTTTADPLNGKGKAVVYGFINGIDTTGAGVGEAWVTNDTLYAHPTIPGGLTKVRPQINIRAISKVMFVDASSGILFVNTISSVKQDDNVVPIGVDRIYFTGDEVVTSQGTFYLSERNEKGTVAVETQVVAVDDNEVNPFPQDYLTEVAASEVTIRSEVRYGQLQYSHDSDQAEELLHIEAYHADPNGLPIDSGIGAIGDLGVKPIFVFDSPRMDNDSGDEFNAPLTSFLDQDYVIPAGDRIRWHILAEKFGTLGGVKNMTIYFGNQKDSWVETPQTITTDDVMNNSGVVGINATEAFNKLNIAGSKILWVDPLGDDSSAVRGTHNKFATPTAAVAAAVSGDLIIVNPGTYLDEHTLVKDGVNWYFFYGAYINNELDFPVFQRVDTANYKVLGYADIRSKTASISQHVVEIGTDQNVDFEFNFIHTFNGDAFRTRDQHGVINIKGDRILSHFHSASTFGGLGNNKRCTYEVRESVMEVSVDAIAIASEMDATLYVTQTFDVIFRNSLAVSKADGKPAMLDTAGEANSTVEYHNCSFGYTGATTGIGVVQFNSTGAAKVSTAKKIFSGATQIYNNDSATGISISYDETTFGYYLMLGDIITNVPEGGAAIGTVTRIGGGTLTEYTPFQIPNLT